MNSSGNTKNILTSDVELKGGLTFGGELLFEGKIEGEITSEGTLNLGDGAIVNGNITVGNVVVRGKVNGNITAKDKVEIKAKAELFGDVRASKLSVEEGVTFVGRAEVNPNKATPAATAGGAPRSTEAAKPPDFSKPILR